MVEASQTFCVVADKFSPAGLEELSQAGIETHYEDALDGETLKQCMADKQPQVLVVRSTKVPKDIIDANPKLKAIIRAGAGYDTIDFAHAASVGVAVANCPGKNATAVAELAMGHILSIDRRMAEGNALLKDGKWNKGMFASCTGIKGRTIGLIGFGAIAKLVCARAKAFEMNVIVHTRTEDPALAEAMGFKYATCAELCAQSDIVSLHVPSGAQTKGMVNKEFLANMKDNAVLINTSRGNVIVDEDLIEKLEACPKFWVGTDVFNGEPSAKATEWSSPLSLHPRVYCTHHCGASTAQAESAIGEEAVRMIKKFVASGEMDNVVNSPKQ